MKSAITAPSSSPASSWRKWPAPWSTGCCRLAAPGTVRFSIGAIGPVIGSRSLNAIRNGLSHTASCRQAARLASDPSYAAAVRAMPDLVPATPDDPASEANRAAWRQLAAWDKPFLVAFSDRDPITGAMAPVLMRTVPGAAGRQHPVLRGAGHFLQEDAGEELGAVIAAFIRAT